MNTAKPVNYLKLTQVAVFCFYLAVGYVPRRSQRFGTQNASQPGTANNEKQTVEKM